MKSDASSDEAPDVEKRISRTDAAQFPTNKAISVIEGVGRPDLRKLVRESTAGTNQATGFGIAACGPDSMMLDVQNARAEAQGRILQTKRFGYILSPSLGSVVKVGRGNTRGDLAKVFILIDKQITYLR